MSNKFPSTEKEIEVYLKLLELQEAAKRADMPLSMHGSVKMRDTAVDKYKRVKEEYLKIVNEIASA